MKVQIQYGKSRLTAHLPQKMDGVILSKKDMPGFLDEETIITEALRNPIDTLPLSRQVKKDDRVVIVTSDITRPFPTERVLPYVVRELQQGGVPLEHITVVFALGSHRSHTEEEKRVLAGALYETGMKFIDSDPDDCELLGTTSRGTPVELFRPVTQADCLILMGNIEYHYFAGYSGGAKALMPGTASKAAIRRNHSEMFSSGAKPGKLAGNPVREDIDETGQFLKIDFILNVILDEQNHIAAAVCGDYRRAHKAGCVLLDAYSRLEVEKPGDIVIIGGGYPKDINLYQAQKWLENGSRLASDRGILIWCAESIEGFGNEIFREWMLTKKPEEMIEKVKKNFVLGGHKAAAIGEILLKHQIYFISGLEESLVRKMGMVPFKGLQDAIDDAIKEKGEAAVILIVPKAMTGLPIFSDRGEDIS